MRLKGLREQAAKLRARNWGLLGKLWPWYLLPLSSNILLKNLTLHPIHTGHDTDSMRLVLNFSDTFKGQRSAKRLPSGSHFHLRDIWPYNFYSGTFHMLTDPDFKMMPKGQFLAQRADFRICCSLGTWERYVARSERRSVRKKNMVLMTQTMGRVFDS